EPPAGRDSESGEEGAGPAGVLGGNDVGAGQRLHRPGRDVAEVPDRGADEDDGRTGLLGLRHSFTSTVSPARSCQRSKAPAAASTTKPDRQTTRVTRQGTTVRVRRTTPWRSQKATSIGKCIPSVWTWRHGRRTNAPVTSPGCRRPRSPWARPSAPRAISALARTSPPSRTSQGIAPPSSDVEADLQDVAVLDLVVLALDAELPLFLGPGPRADREQLVPPDDLGPDEPPLEVGVDHAGALGGPGAGPERPGPALLVAGGEERPPAEEVVGGVGHPGDDTLAEAEPLQQLRPLLGVEPGRLRLELDRHGEGVGAEG